MAVVRTLVVTVPPLLADLVADALRPRLTLLVVGVLHTRDGLTEQLRALAPDLVLLGLASGEPDSAAEALLAALPTAGILALAPGGRDTWLHEMRPVRTPLADFSVATLADALVSRFPPTPP